jgi:hypothetical protein
VRKESAAALMRFAALKHAQRHHILTQRTATRLQFLTTTSESEGTPRMKRPRAGHRAPTPRAAAPDFIRVGRVNDERPSTRQTRRFEITFDASSNGC